MVMYDFRKTNDVNVVLSILKKVLLDYKILDNKKIMEYEDEIAKVTILLFIIWLNIYLNL